MNRIHISEKMKNDPSDYILFENLMQDDNSPKPSGSGHKGSGCLVCIAATAIIIAVMAIIAEVF